MGPHRQGQDGANALVIAAEFLGLDVRAESTAVSARDHDISVVLDGVDEFALVCGCLGLDDHSTFIDGCHWHFERYPHYLGRRRHFEDYFTYVRDRHGPVRVQSPPQPNWLRTR